MSVRDLSPRWPADNCAGTSEVLKEFVNQLEMIMLFLIGVAIQMFIVWIAIALLVS